MSGTPLPGRGHQGGEGVAVVCGCVEVHIYVLVCRVWICLCVWDVGVSRL